MVEARNSLTSGKHARDDSVTMLIEYKVLTFSENESIEDFRVNDARLKKFQY